MIEVWRDVTGYEGLYQISNLGNLLSFHKKKCRLITPKKNVCGYLWYSLHKNGGSKPLLSHRLVAMHFIDNPQNYPIINHKDENPMNNRVDNLEWCDNSYNILYSLKRGWKRKPSSPRHRRSGLIYKCSSTVPICQFDLNGNIIRVWDSFAQIKHAMGKNESSIRYCCKGKRKTAYGFKWAFAHENTPQENAV